MRKKQPHVKEVFTYPDGTTLVYYQQNLNKCTDVSVGFRIPRVSSPSEDEIIGVYNKNLVFYQSFDDTIRIPIIKPGLPHFVEHMIYSSLPDMEIEKIYQFFTKTNTKYNAYTSSDSLVAVFNCPSKFNEEVFGLFSKMIFRDSYNKVDLKNEKKPVYQELQMHFDSSENILSDIFCSNSNFLSGADILGRDKKIIDSFDEKQMIRFIKSYFTKQNMIISVVSDKPFEEIKALCEKNFIDKAPSVEATKVKTPTPVCKFDDCFIAEKDKKSNTSQISIVLQSNADSETNSIYSVVEDFILNEFNGRLLTKLRNDDGMVYTSSFSQTQLFYNSGAFKIFGAITTKKNVKDVANSMLSILYDMARNGITDEEFEGFKQMWESRRNRVASFKYDDADEMFNRILYNQKPFVGEFNKKISNLTKKDIDNYLKQIYSNAKYCFYITGNFDEKDLPTRAEISKFRPLDEYMQDKFLDMKGKEEFISYLEHIQEHPEDNKKIKFVKDSVYKEYLKMLSQLQDYEEQEETENAEEDQIDQEYTEEFELTKNK